MSLCHRMFWNECVVTGAAAVKCDMGFHNDYKRTLIIFCIYNEMNDCLALDFH